ncbi:MAG: N-acetylmuramoyl-L-alanine amidase [Akkermansiaceae bacterium]|nr:N-acetylmuramoyl-L-alanine amidase [Armatimonadota bacterium]
MEDGYVAIHSPNHNSRPFFSAVDCVVLHATVTETADDAVRIFLNRRSKVSAHFVVARDGRVIQMVPLGKRAWHGGTSRLGRRANVNDFSVGIEIVNRNDGSQPYTDRQYKAVAAIIRRLRTEQHYRIPPERIVSHRAIALPEGRKSDPRGFDFFRLRRLLARP